MNKRNYTMKAFAQRDFVQPVKHTQQPSDARVFRAFENIMHVWVPLFLSIFGSVWLLSLVYKLATL
jgi:hypothetical protein